MRRYHDNRHPIFQSTLSVRRATSHSSRRMLGYMISIHALREESDLGLHTISSRPKHFNPRSP